MLHIGTKATQLMEFVFDHERLFVNGNVFIIYIDYSIFSLENILS